MRVGGRRISKAIVIVLVVVRFAIRIQVLQTDYAVARQDIGTTVNQTNTERLVKPGRKTFPDDFLHAVLQARDFPNVAHQRCEVSSSVLREINPAEHHHGAPWVLERHANTVDDIGSALLRHGYLLVE